MKKNYLIYALWMAVFLSSNVVSAQNYFGDFPVKADPKTVGNKLSKRLMETKHQLYGDRGIHYASCSSSHFQNSHQLDPDNNQLSVLLYKKPY